MGLPMILFIVFLILKLVGVIAWSWWWVTSPLWIAAIVGVIFALFSTCVVAAGVSALGRRGR